ncbi:hypothetical protein CEXT_267891 [Caerostris extrusa]|uniref:Uncharacterized protein n=1 Tax=Caerostris extrusa TaxID=172846 RepID=A0AAV4TNH0_CAEEX|nr:hypothetical protein CEXT_267891 [Caerostris extrusa]
MEARIEGRRNEVITGGGESFLMGMGFQTEGGPAKFTTYHLDGEEFKCISPRNSLKQFFEKNCIETYRITTVRDSYNVRGYTRLESDGDFKERRRRKKKKSAKRHQTRGFHILCSFLQRHSSHDSQNSSDERI